MPSSLAVFTLAVTLTLCIASHAELVDFDHLVHVTDARLSERVFNRLAGDETVRAILLLNRRILDAEARQVLRQFSTASTALQLQLDAQGLFLERNVSVEFNWGWCEATGVDPLGACEAAHRWGLLSKFHPSHAVAAKKPAAPPHLLLDTVPLVFEVVVLDRWGSRKTSLERHHLLADPEAFAAALISLARPPVVKTVHSLSDLEALPAVIASRALLRNRNDDVRSALYPSKTPVVVLGLRRSIDVTSSRSSFAAFLKVAESIGSTLRGVALVYMATDTKIVETLISIERCLGDAHETATPLQADNDYVVGVTFGVTRRFGERDTETACVNADVASVLKHADGAFLAAQRGGDGALESKLRKRWALSVKAVSPVALVSKVSEISVAVHVLHRVKRTLFDVVEVSTPLRRDWLLSRTPECSLVHVLPRLLRLRQPGSDFPQQLVPLDVEPAGISHDTTLGSHVAYYRRRLASVVTRINAALRSAHDVRRCSVTLVDPSVDKDLLDAFGWKASDVYRTSAEIRRLPIGTSSALGKTRDQMLVLAIGSSKPSQYHRFNRSTFEARAVEAFVVSALAIGSNVPMSFESMACPFPLEDPNDGDAACLSRSALRNGMYLFPWGNRRPRPWPHARSFAPSTSSLIGRCDVLTTLTSAALDNALASDISRHYLVLLTSRHSPTAAALSAMMESLLVDVAAFHLPWDDVIPRSSLRIVRVDLSQSDAPAQLIPFLSDTRSTTDDGRESVMEQLPLLFFLPRERRGVGNVPSSLVSRGGTFKSASSRPDYSLLGSASQTSNSVAIPVPLKTVLASSNDDRQASLALHESLKQASSYLARLLASAEESVGPTRPSSLTQTKPRDAAFPDDESRDFYW